MISEQDIYDQAYADGYNAGYTQAALRAESRVEIGLPLVVTDDDADS